MYKIVEEAIEPESLYKHVLRDCNGAIVTFSGVVRDHSGNVRTDHLEYEAYAAMAEKVLEEIGSEAMAEWAVEDVAVLHRVGRVEIGEISVLISVGSAHRSEAFKACNYIIDQLKERAPIWKKEVGKDGAYWVEGPQATAVED